MMSRRLLAAVLVAVVLAVIPGGALADGMVPEGLPPGVHAQAHQLMVDMMQHMQDIGMSNQQMTEMTAHMEMMAEELPPGVFLELLRLMNALDAEAMMQLHAMMHSGDMASRSPGNLIAAAQMLARS
ncbi:MAG: hypothetical protein ACYC4L_22275 [Chloroflexota bacterium]